mmetsp:Transcript_61004/g.131208  ORF Transcript_61004/g.131208 Transcript_61004/m.131208 type:complete len:103 (-) Transcript_61004:14-322(-)
MRDTWPDPIGQYTMTFFIVIYSFYAHPPLVIQRGVIGMLELERVQIHTQALSFLGLQHFSLQCFNLAVILNQTPFHSSNLRTDLFCRRHGKQEGVASECWLD